MAGHLISRDELLAAGALDVPPAWRKSLQAGLPKPKKNDPQRELFGDDEEPQPTAEAEAAEADVEEDSADDSADDSDDDSDEDSADDE